jgi:hypothetical protein
MARQLQQKVGALQVVLSSMHDRTSTKAGRSLLWTVKGSDSIQAKDLERDRVPVK